MIPLISGALAALQLAERAAESGVWTSNVELEQLKAELSEIERRFDQICDVLGCGHTLADAMAEVQHWDRTLARLTIENADMREEIVRLDAELESEREEKPATSPPRKRKAKPK